MPIGLKTTIDTPHPLSQEDANTTPSGYRPTSEYAPTMTLCQCALCQHVGIVEFEGGFNLKLGDRLMEGRRIPGNCKVCNRPTTVLPLRMLSEGDWKEYQHLRRIQDTLDYYTQHNIPINLRDFIIPKERLEAFQKGLEEHQNGRNS